MTQPPPWQPPEQPPPDQAWQPPQPHVPQQRQPHDEPTTPISATPDQQSEPTTPVPAESSPAVPTSTEPTPAAPTSAAPISAAPVSAAPVSAAPSPTTPVSAAPGSGVPHQDPDPTTPISAAPPLPVDPTAPVSGFPHSGFPQPPQPGQPWAQQSDQPWQPPQQPGQPWTQSPLAPGQPWQQSPLAPGQPWQQSPPAPGQPWQQQPAPGQAWPPQPGQPQPGQPWPPQQPADWQQQPGWQQAPPPMPPAPPREPKKTDRLAAAAGNASFLSLGYFMMRRAGFGVLTLLVSFILLFFIVPSVHTVWIEVVAVLWWLAMIVHGYFLAQGPVEPSSALRQRIVGIAAAVVVLLVLGLLRVQAGGIGQAVTDAKANGDCTHALEKLDQVWLGLRIADAPLAAKDDDTVTACHKLNDARDTIKAGLASADTTELNEGFGQLNSVLSTMPGHEKMTDKVLDQFLAGLPVSNACDTVKITQWLGDRAKSGNTLDRSADVVPQIEPAALMGCADGFMTSKDWTDAKGVYQQLINAYPNDPNIGQAKDGIAKADLAIELDTLRERTTGSTPSYCEDPSKYSVAKAYGKGVNRALIFGNSTQSGRLPAAWKTTDPEAANLVLCVSSDAQGAAVRTCDYRSQFGTGGLYPVTFHKVKVTVKGYEIRTGRLIINQTLQFGGSSCPSTVHYTTTLGTDFGPPRHMTVTVNAAEVRTQFQKLIVK
ncbi:hypothetical protein [Actinoplanes sp. HUAS TT8]|uniref:hypothetical protein n=1 Tax=Actinoplanes sp. HUAS TT8 TaxID=3447453 RepID=UPI003F51AED6